MTDADNFLRIDDVQRITGLSRSGIYKYVSIGSFPKSVPITGKAVAWLESEVRNWQRARVAERDARGAIHATA